MKENIKRMKVQRPDQGGFTLVELLAAMAILLMASQILLFGNRFAANMEAKARDLEMARREIGEHLLEKNDGYNGTIRLEINGLCEDLVQEGWLYTGYNENAERDRFQIIWAEIPEDE